MPVGVFSWNMPGFSTTDVCVLGTPLQPDRDPAAPLCVAVLVENASLECGVAGEAGRIEAVQVLTPFFLHPGAYLLVVEELLFVQPLLIAEERNRPLRVGEPDRVRLENQLVPCRPSLYGRR